MSILRYRSSCPTPERASIPTSCLPENDRSREGPDRPRLWRGGSRGIRERRLRKDSIAGAVRGGRGSQRPGAGRRRYARAVVLTGDAGAARAPPTLAPDDPDSARPARPVRTDPRRAPGGRALRRLAAGRRRAREPGLEGVLPGQARRSVPPGRRRQRLRVPLFAGLQPGDAAVPAPPDRRLPGRLDDAPRRALAWTAGRLSLPLLLLQPVVASIALGNIEILMAAAIVAGFRWPATWSFVLLSKVTPGSRPRLVRRPPGVAQPGDRPRGDGRRSPACRSSSRPTCGPTGSTSCAATGDVDFRLPVVPGPLVGAGRHRRRAHRLGRPHGPALDGPGRGRPRRAGRLVHARSPSRPSGWPGSPSARPASRPAARSSR